MNDWNVFVKLQADTNINQSSAYTSCICIVIVWNNVIYTK